MKEIKLYSTKYKNLIALVDDEDFEYLNKFTWYPIVSKFTTYAYRKDGTIGIRMHREILKLPIDKPDVDHIDHNGLNNQKCNLRIVTVSQNMMNKRKGDKITSSKYKGVNYTTRRNGLDEYWIAQCTVGYRTRNSIRKFELCKTEVEAAIAYNKLAIELHGEYACLNRLTIEDELLYQEVLKFNKSIEGKSFCNMCKNYLPYADFRKGSSKGKNDGCSTYCRICFRKYEKDNGWNNRKR